LKEDEARERREQQTERRTRLERSKESTPVIPPVK
jgi:hypothetical protein